MRCFAPEQSMPITTSYCHVLPGTVTRITDLEGAVLRVNCAEYDDRNGGCRLKQQTLRGGPLSQLLDRVNEATLDRRTELCDLAQ